ncbi:MAG: CapA family protein [Clostridia bacterium]|nr:CapA family protein [Clostridia bacterium]
MLVAGGNAQEPSPTPKEPVTTKVSFVGCGDNIIYKGNVIDAKELRIEGGRRYNFKPIYDEVSETVRNADIAFINQETVMCGDGYELSYYPNFNSPRDVGYDLLEVGYDVINIANNHMLDKGSEGLLRTIEFWKSMDCLMIGGYENESDFDTPRILEKNGIKIAFLSYTYDTNGYRVSVNSEIKIPYIEDTDIKRQVELAKANAEFVAVSVHWGEEGHMTPSDEQRRVAKLMADAGVDVIIGHHPHVIQPVEWITGAAGNKTLCVYSLGNFAAEQAYDYNMVGGMIKFDIVKTDDQKPYIENVVFNPTVFHYNSNFRGNKVYFMQDYTPELAAKHGVRGYYKNSLYYDRILKYAKDTIAIEFLPEDMK